VSTIPTSTSIVMRPVWHRRQRRHYSEDVLGPPTDDEMHDAIMVLSDRQLQKEAPALWLEAETIHQEATEASEARVS
jgi:hypothetical protein